MLDGNYKILYDRLQHSVDVKRIYHDPLHTLALGTDASFYRLIPRMAIRTINENEVSFILRNCTELKIPVTFRAAGTSLSGQAITDSVLLIAGNSWDNYSIGENGYEISLQPGLTGGKVNALLAKYGRKIGPDPASINSAMIGGIAANNASGMCCGTSRNSYKTVSGMRIVLAGGTVLDTRDKYSRDSFLKTHTDLVAGLTSLAASVKQNQELLERIRHKYKIKNTTGYSLNALTDFSDPFDLIEHLMIGSEGTLGFISEISYNTVPVLPYRASSLMIFTDINTACSAVVILKSTPVTAVELIDRTGLRSVENEKGIPGFLKTLPEDFCSLLVETGATGNTELLDNIASITRSLEELQSEGGIGFTSVASEYENLWKIRSGLFPSVGAMRPTGTTVIIEDVAFPLNLMAYAIQDLRDILKKYRYNEAVIFGHALEGNMHFVFTQDFSTSEEIDRYGNMMSEVADMVVKKYDGSLKAEHGTGRNMAPFVELEWGKDAYNLMKQIKQLFDPHNILNPGVILNDDPEIHLSNLKPIPPANEIIDKCTECGFCEVSCVSADLTLTPRQRIVIHREIASLRKTGHQPHMAASLTKSFEYEGESTCATDGLCSLSCPAGIDTGKLIKYLRSNKSTVEKKRAMRIAGNMGAVTSAGRVVLKAVDFFHTIFGTTLMKKMSGGLRFISGNIIPLWNPYMPNGAKKVNDQATLLPERNGRFVYFPSCINRSMGVSADHRQERQLSDKIVQLASKAGFEVIYPENLNELCCGMAFLSKGYTEAGKLKSNELEQALFKASNSGEYPVLCDMSPCLFTMKENMESDMRLFEPVEFISTFLLPHLEIKPLDETITVFPVCSMKKMGLDPKLAELARACASEVIVAESACCGFAGDRGFSFPELNAHGLRNLKKQLPANVRQGYSTSRTCEIGLSLNTGISYKSIIYLVDKVSSPAKIK
jgi:D-lactate dehydrogenase